MIHRRLLVVVALGVLPSAVHAQVRVGPEFRVNDYTTGSQGLSRVAIDPAGNFLVTWISEGQDGSGYGVYARWHAPDGAPLGASEFRANAFTTGRQSVPMVAAAPDGAMVVAWVGEGQDGSSYSVHARRYPSAAGVPGPELLVNAHTTGVQDRPAVAVDGSGNFVVVWHGSGATDSLGVFGRRFDALGAPRGGDFRVNAYTTFTQANPAVASDAAGNFVVVWEDVVQDGSSYGVFAQRYDATGARVGPEFRVNAYTTGRQRRPAVASDADGNFVVVWNSDQAGPYDVWGRRYDAAGLPRGEAFQVNVVATGNQTSAAVASDDEGAFVVVWEGETTDGGGVFGRRYDSSGIPEATQFALSSYTTGTQFLPGIGAHPQGDFVATWTSAGQDGSSYGVFAQRFRPDLILRDGFEDGTLAAWSFAATDGGDLSVSPLASLKSTAAGLQAVVDDTSGLYVQDDRPQSERRYRARFYFDPNGFDPGEALGHRRTRIFIAFSEAPVRRLASVVLRRLDGQYAIRGRARLDDNRQAETAFLPITDEPHVIEIDVRPSATPTSVNGQFTLTIDGTPAFMVLLDNNLAEVDFVRMGALSVKPGANGTMYWDEFESRRQAAIGP